MADNSALQVLDGDFGILTQLRIFNLISVGSLVSHLQRSSGAMTVALVDWNEFRR